MLFQLDDAAVETVDIVGGPEAGLPPHLFAEMFGQALAELGVFAGQTGDAVMGVGQVGNEGWPADARSSGPCGGWFGGFEEYRGVKVAVAIKEAAVHPGAASDRGDAYSGAPVDCLLERGEDSLPASCAVNLPGRGDAVGVVVHGLSSPALGSGLPLMAGMLRLVVWRVRRTAEMAAAMSACSAGASCSRCSPTRCTSSFTRRISSSEGKASVLAHFSRSVVASKRSRSRSRSCSYAFNSGRCEGSVWK